jgi:hypothetical protein
MFKGETTLSNHAHMFKRETTTIKTQDMQTIQTWRDTGKAQRTNYLPWIFDLLSHVMKLKNTNYLPWIFVLLSHFQGR